MLGWMEHTSPTHSSHRASPPAQIVVLIGIAHALVIYRVVAVALFTQSSLELLREQANTAAVVTGAVLHYLTIVIMTKVGGGAGWPAGLLPALPPPTCSCPCLLQVNRRMALYLCDLGKGSRGLSWRAGQAPGGQGRPANLQRAAGHRRGSRARSHRSATWVLLPSPEKPRTFSQRENNFTVKIFTFQFFTNFSSLIYIAFFLGR